MDKFKGHRKTLDSVCDRATAVVPSDASDLIEVSRAIYVGNGGSITVVLAGIEDAVQFVNVPSGVILPIRARRVLATGTTASAMLAMT